MRYRLLIEYDGTRYSGWQAQKGLRTVQGAFLNALDQIFPGQKTEVYGAGRTDSGVHALAQVAHLVIPEDWSTQNLQYRLNDLLPSDINVLEIANIKGNFHARHDAVYRSYVYLISKRRTAFGKSHCWWVKDQISAGTMRKTARLFEGMHNFRSFTDQKPEEGSTLVEIKFVDIHETSGLIAIHVTGSHFLWKMVRRMTGILVEAGRGNLGEEKIKLFLEKYTGEVARYTAPPSGLYLHRVYYQGDNLIRGKEVIPGLLNY